MDRNNGPEAKLETSFFKEETTTITTMGLGGTPQIINITSLKDKTLHTAIIAQTMEDPLINAQVSHLIEAMEIDPEMDLSTTRVGTGGKMESSLVLHRIKGETSHKVTHIAKQEMTNLTTLLSADLTIDQRLVSLSINKKFRRTTIKRHLMWSASPQLTMPLMNYQIFAR